MLNGGEAKAPNENTAPAAEPTSPGNTARPEASDQPASQPASPPASAPSSSGNAEKNDWFRSAFNQMRYGVPASQPEAHAPAGDTPESDRAGGDKAQVPPSAEGGQEQKPKPPARDAKTEAPDREDTSPISADELDRRVQSEVDRRMAKIQREEADRRKREQRRALRDKDPYAFAQAEREAEAEAEQLQKQIEEAHKLALSSMHAYDASVLDPLMTAVPAEARKKILDGIGPGIPGRGQAATQALKALEQHWKGQGVAEARKTLINDQSFVKEVLAKYGGTRIEPDLVPAAAAPAPAFSMNSWLRESGNRVRGRSSR